MAELIVALAVLTTAALATVLRRRHGRTDTVGTFRKEDTVSPGAHAGFTNHIGGG